VSRIVFIEPKAPNLHIFSQYPIPRLGVFILGALMKRRGWDAEVYVEESRRLEYDTFRNADLVGISTTTSTAPRAYAIADRLREMGLPVIMGGAHVTFLADEALEHADFVVRGEGEAPLMAFIDAWEKKSGFSNVPGLSYHHEDEKRHNPVSGRTPELDELPFPDFSLWAGASKRALRGLRIVPVQTSRGCPYGCSFCSVTGMFGRRYRFRSTENVIRELRTYDDRKNVIFFYDDNFAADPRRTRDLLEAMIRERFKFRWTTQVRADVTRDPEIVRLMKKSGCHTLFIGLESVNPESLKDMKKEQTVDEVFRAVRMLRKNGIRVHGMFVYGFDQDDWTTVKETVRFAKKSGLTSTQFLILTPLPGSPIFDKMRSEGRISFRDWALYDAHHPVFRPARLSLFELQKAQIFSHSRFYSLPRMLCKFLEGKWTEFGMAAYARRINRLWKRRNSSFLRVLKLLRPRIQRKAEIAIDYRERIRL
jgi:radical SAM superfamily enzyme YgiQ (UPF0313 family)